MSTQGMFYSWKRASQRLCTMVLWLPPRPAGRNTDSGGIDKHGEEIRQRIWEGDRDEDTGTTTRRCLHGKNPQCNPWRRYLVSRLMVAFISVRNNIFKQDYSLRRGRGDSYVTNAIRKTRDQCLQDAVDVIDSEHHPAVEQACRHCARLNGFTRRACQSNRDAWYISKPTHLSSSVI